MRSFQFTEPGDTSVLAYNDIQIPTPKKDEVLIRVEYAGLNFADTLARRGAPGYSDIWPFTPGLEVVGTVEKSESTQFGTGDSVVAFTANGGGYAEYVIANANLTVKLPDNLNKSQATGIPLTWATALGIVERANVKKTDSVLITSAQGGLGRALTQVLSSLGLKKIYGGVGTLTKLQDSQDAISLEVRDENFFETITTANGKPIDVILDSVGGTLLSESLNHLAIGGRLISYGGAAGQPDPNNATFGALRINNHTVSGFSILRLARTAPEIVRTLMTQAIDVLLSNGGLPIPREISWDELLQAHIAQSEGKFVGKTVVKVTT